MTKQFVKLTGYFEGKRYTEEQPETIFLTQDQIQMGKEEDTLVNLLIGTSKFTLTPTCTAKFNAAAIDLT